MLTTELVITIPGHPAPKGSLKCVARHERGARQQLVEDNARTKVWRSTLAGWMSRSWPAAQNADKGQPVGAEITFTLPRPKGHYGTGRNVGIVKPTAPKHPVSHLSGDVDKLLRLALDAVQDSPTLPDDCAVVEVTTRKAYVRTVEQEWGDVLGYPGVVIRLYPIEDPCPS